MNKNEAARRGINKERAQLNKQRDLLNHRRKEFEYEWKLRERANAKRDWLCIVCLGLLLLCVIVYAVSR